MSRPARLSDWGEVRSKVITWHDPQPTMVTARSGVLRAVGRVTKPGQRVAYASAEIRDAHNKLVATATSSLLIIESSSSVRTG